MRLSTQIRSVSLLNSLLVNISAHAHWLRTASITVCVCVTSGDICLNFYNVLCAFRTELTEQGMCKTLCLVCDVTHTHPVWTILNIDNIDNTFNTKCHRKTLSSTTVSIDFANEPQR